MKYISILLSFVLGAPLLAESKKPQVKKPSIGEAARPVRKPFPPHWGKPPRIQTKDFRPLPHGFGMGSSTLAKWILGNIEKDKKNPNFRPKPPVKPKPRPRPEPSPEIKAKIDALKEKRKAIQSERKKLGDELKGKSREEVRELIKAFKEANKDKHREVKEAHQELVKSIREKRQTGDRRE